MLDLEQLKTFRLVAITKSFTRAAAELGCSQSNVTSRIKLLERELGAPLLERFRFSRKVVLTDVGRRTFDYSEKLLALADETRVAIHQDTDPSGHLRIGAPESLLTYRLPGLLHRFQVLYPNVQLEIRADTDPEMLTISVSEGLVDMAFVIDLPIHSENMTSESLLKEEMLIVAHPDHEFASRADLRPTDLMQAPILFADYHCSFWNALNRMLRESGVRPESSLEVGSLEAVKQCAMAGMGIAILPKMSVISELDQKLLVKLNWVGPEIAAHTQMIRNKARWTLPALTALWNLASQTLRMELAYQL